MEAPRICQRSGTSIVSWFSDRSCRNKWNQLPAAPMRFLCLLWWLAPRLKSHEDVRIVQRWRDFYKGVHIPPAKVKLVVLIQSLFHRSRWHIKPATKKWGRFRPALWGCWLVFVIFSHEVPEIIACQLSRLTRVQHTLDFASCTSQFGDELITLCTFCENRVTFSVFVFSRFRWCIILLPSILDSPLPLQFICWDRVSLDISPLMALSPYLILASWVAPR